MGDGVPDMGAALYPIPCVADKTACRVLSLLPALLHLLYTPCRGETSLRGPDEPIVYKFAWLLFVCLVLSGCEENAPPPEAPADPLTEIGRDFNPDTAGVIRGQVIWQGAIPQVPSYRAPVSPGSEHAGDPRRDWPNPNTPHIDPQTKAVADAVVFLRGVDPRRAQPWDLPPVRIELRDFRIHILQGHRDGASAFVRRGEAIEMMSVQPIYHSLQARGAAFFSLAFPDVDDPCSRRLDRRGLVELMSGCGHFWMRGWLFVEDHPYYTHTDAQGRFSLSNVPPGQYELVCWLPDWHEAARELDAETAHICRLTFRPPVEIVQPIAVDPRQTQTIPIRVSAQRFLDLR